ncbi:MAG: type IV pilus biogenesis/stability protein PilW, partial [Crocosphaera sp.]
AIDYFNTAIELNRFNSIAYHNLGLVYLLQDKLDEAKLLLTKAVEINSYDGNAFLRLGILQALEGDIEQAKISWQNGLKWYGEYAQNKRIFRTIYLIALGEIEQGLTTLRTILSKEKPPIGLLNRVLEIAYLLKRCPQLQGINEAIIMIENNINYQL